LAPRSPLILPALPRAFDQPTVGQEIFDGGESLDVADFVEDGQAQVLTDAGTGLKQSTPGQATFLVWRLSSSSSWQI